MIGRLRAIAMLVLLGGILAPRPVALPTVHANPNTERAGTLRDGVLTVTLEASQSTWYLDGPRHRPMTIEAFAEPGKTPVIPGPLVRAPAGTEIRFSVRNSLAKPLTFLMPAALHGGPDRIGAMDSVVIAPGAVESVTTRATTAGSYIYRATVPGRAGKAAGISGLLTGAIVIDAANAPTRPHDRVFVLMETPDSAMVACADTTHAAGPLASCLPTTRTLFTLNGRSWPNTERIHASVGDSLHWRVINASFNTHPMHLHGFYYRVDDFSGPLTEPDERPARGQMVVTQQMTRFSSMSMTWSPDRPGNWLFHCHFALHNTPSSLEASPDDPYLRDMVGLVLGTIVTRPTGVVVAGHPVAARRLRLVAEHSLRGPDGNSARHPTTPAELVQSADFVPFTHFLLEERGRQVVAGKDFSPELDLVRGEPVAITVVNHLDEPISVHWHGIEVQDSYVDGVPGFSGEGKHLTRAIAPGDSFLAHFTPPRAGTFMYHAHIDEVREELGGLEGALIVRDPVVAPSPDDHVIFLKGLVNNMTHPLEIDGRSNPDTMVLHVGRPARFRLLNLSTTSIGPIFSITARADSTDVIARDSMLVLWRPVAKDGFDFPESERAARPAQQQVGVGEIYDFEYTPPHPGTLRLEVRSRGAQHQMLIRVPIRVE